MNNKKLILAVIALVVVVAAMLTVFFVTRPKPAVDAQGDGTQSAGKTFTVIVVHGDGTKKEFTYTTDQEKLGGYLEEIGLINSEGADAGMFHTVDGEKADWNTNRSYWALYEGDTYANQGIFDTLIVDGATYRLEYTVG